MFENYSPQALRDAIEIELQSNDDPKTAAIIAMERLKKDPEYYTKKYGILTKAKDTTKLIRKQIINKMGKRQTVWVKPVGAEKKEESGNQKIAIVSKTMSDHKKLVDEAKKYKTSEDFIKRQLGDNRSFEELKEQSGYRRYEFNFVAKEGMEAIDIDDGEKLNLSKKAARIYNEGKDPKTDLEMWDSEDLYKLSYIESSISIEPGEKRLFYRKANHLPKIGDKSHNFRDDKDEKGLSVYFSPRSTSFAGDAKGDWIYGEGMQVGWGSDDEPLIVPVGDWKKYPFRNKQQLKEFWEKTHSEKKEPTASLPQTETPEFKAWFGDSKVVDESGKPLVVYHGSDKELTSIQPGYDEPGAWFTSDKKNASNYAKGLDAAIHAVYLKAENPFVVKFDDDMQPMITGMNQDDMEELGLDNNVSIVKYAQKKRFDSVHFPDGNFSESDNTWVVFSPNQIKSATGNRGTFDPNEADMTKARGPVKYYKKITMPNGKTRYFYTQKEFKDYQKGQIAPEEKVGKFNLLSTIRNLFGFSDDRQAKEKVKADYKDHAIADRFSISLESWASHLSEYFTHKDKWTAFFNKKKEDKEKVAAADKKKAAEKKEKAERPKTSIKLSVMKAIHDMYGTVKPVQAKVVPVAPEAESDYTQWLKGQSESGKEIESIIQMSKNIKDPKARKKFLQKEKHDFETKWSKKFSERNDVSTDFDPASLEPAPGETRGFIAEDEYNKYWNDFGKVYKIPKEEIIEGVEGMTFGDKVPIPLEDFLKQVEANRDNFDTMPESESGGPSVGARTKRGLDIQEATGKIIQNVIDYIERGTFSAKTFLAGADVTQHIDKDLGRFASNPIVWNAVVAAVKRKYFPTEKDIAKQVVEVEKKKIERNIEIIDTGNGSKIETNIKETPKQEKESKDNEELAAREGYFNEKPAEILNVGKDVWGAARHNFDTYERVNVDINQMETDGTAAAYVTKKNLFGDYGLANKDERVSKGETEYKVLASFVMREYLAKMPGDNEDSRQKYMEFCRAIVRLDQDTTTAKAFLVGLSEVYGNLFPMPEQIEGRVSGKKFNKEAPQTLGMHIHLIMTAIQGDPDRAALYGLDKKEKREFESIAKIISGEIDRKYSYDEIKEGMFGKVKASGIKLKKGDNVVFTEAWKDNVKMVKSDFPTPEDEVAYKKINENITELYSYETALDYGAFIHGTPPEAGEKYNVSMLMQDSSGKTKMFKDDVFIESVKDGWVRYKIEGGGTGGMSLGAFARDLRRTNIQPLQINKGRKKDVLGELNKRFGTNFTDDQDAKDYLLSEISSSKEKAKTHIVRNVFYPEEKGQIVKAGKDKVLVSFKFPDGTIKTFNVPPEMIKQENIESVKRDAERKGTKKLDLYIESKVERIGGKDFSGLSVAKAQEVLKNDFKLKSVQYGNSMPDTERQYHTQWAAQSFSDLSDILKIPMQQITVNGKLGVAFGARGNVTAFSGALAHYEPGSKMINITRSNGVGTLAHEWGHFLDNVLTTETGQGYISSTPRYVEKEISPGEIKHGSIYEVERRTRRGSPLKVERYFYDANAKNKSYPFVKLNTGQSAPGIDPRGVSFYWFNNGGKEKVKEPVPVPFMDKAQEIAQKSIESLQVQIAKEISNLPDDPGNVAVMETKEDLMAMVQDTYLNSNDEAFARAFETYVADKLENNGRKNTYLASKKKTSEKVGAIVYPQKEFRESIGKMFDEFFDLIRGSEDLKKAIVRATGKMFTFRRKNNDN